MNKDEIKVKSLHKAIDVLNCFTEKPSLGVTEISEKLGLYKSNVHNILTTFKAINYLEQDEESGKYRLGIAVFSLCRALGDNFTITKIAMPYMQELANMTNERVYLGIPVDDEVVYLESMYPAESFSLMRTLMGERAKMYCTGIGKAMLANLPEERIEACINMDLAAFTENTITDKEKLREELRLTKERGYAIDDMEHEFGIRCVAVPIFNRYRQLEAAISVSGPSLRFDDEKVIKIAKLLSRYIEKIENRL